jgi:hypothetical protein
MVDQNPLIPSHENGKIIPPSLHQNPVKESTDLTTGLSLPNVTIVGPSRNPYSPMATFLSTVTGIHINNPQLIVFGEFIKVLIQKKDDDSVLIVDTRTLERFKSFQGIKNNAESSNFELTGLQYAVSKLARFFLYHPVAKDMILHDLSAENGAPVLAQFAREKSPDPLTIAFLENWAREEYVHMLFFFATAVHLTNETPEVLVQKINQRAESSPELLAQFKEPWMIVAALALDELFSVQGYKSDLQYYGNFAVITNNGIFDGDLLKRAFNCVIRDEGTHYANVKNLFLANWYEHAEEAVEFVMVIIKQRILHQTQNDSGFVLDIEATHFSPAVLSSCFVKLVNDFTGRDILNDDDSKSIAQKAWLDEMCIQLRGIHSQYSLVNLQKNAETDVPSSVNTSIQLMSTPQRSSFKSKMVEFLSRCTGMNIVSPRCIDRNAFLSSLRYFRSKLELKETYDGSVETVRDMLVTADHDRRSEAGATVLLESVLENLGLAADTIRALGQWEDDEKRHWYFFETITQLHNSNSANTISNDGSDAHIDVGTNSSDPIYRSIKDERTLLATLILDECLTKNGYPEDRAFYSQITLIDQQGNQHPYLCGEAFESIIFDERVHFITFANLYKKKYMDQGSQDFVNPMEHIRNLIRLRIEGTEGDGWKESDDQFLLDIQPKYISEYFLISAYTEIKYTLYFSGKKAVGFDLETILRQHDCQTSDTASVLQSLSQTNILDETDTQFLISMCEHINQAH